MTRIAKILSAAAWAGLLCASVSAQARTASFYYYDDELHTVRGVNQLLKRLRQAAEAECSARQLLLSKAELECRRDVESQWVARIANPMLTKLSRSTPALAAR